MRTRLPLAGSPQATADMAFFVALAIGDLDGDGDNEVVAGNGTYMVDAYDGTGPLPAAGPSSRVAGASARRASGTGWATAASRSPR